MDVLAVALAVVDVEEVVEIPADVVAQPEGELISGTEDAEYTKSPYVPVRDPSPGSFNRPIQALPDPERVM